MIENYHLLYISGLDEKYGCSNEPNRYCNIKKVFCARLKCNCEEDKWQYLQNSVSNAISFIHNPKQKYQRKHEENDGQKRRHEYCSLPPEIYIDNNCITHIEIKDSRLP